MRNKSAYLILITIFLAVYYLICGIYLNKLGYFNAEVLFYIEKAKIVFDGAGNRLKVMGLTSPILPFYATFPFTTFGNYLLAPVMASAIGTALLFYLLATTLIKNAKGNFYLYVLLALFLFHPGMLYTACSGKSIYMVLIFFYLFFFNILRFYRSNTTFHVSIASICLVMLTFCDYRFIWLSLFFIPLVLSIAVHSLNLSEKESIFRIFLSFNNPSLRRKLLIKTLALYSIIFFLPVASIISYKLLNLTHANDLNYFLESPYATWTVLADKLAFDLSATNYKYHIPDISILLSFKIVLYCPLMLLAIYLFRDTIYLVLTLLTPFALVEFLRIKYDKAPIAQEYYLIFVMLALLCVLTRSQWFKNQRTIRIVIAAGVLIQIYTGYYFLKHSATADERNFISMLLNPVKDNNKTINRNIAAYINRLPTGSQILLDDATAYPIAAFVETDKIKNLIMPYQQNYLTAIETPKMYVDYILVATEKNAVTGYTQLNNRYLDIIKASGSAVSFIPVYETDNWVLYKVQ